MDASVSAVRAPRNGAPLPFPVHYDAARRLIDGMPLAAIVCRALDDADNRIGAAALALLQSVADPRERADLIADVLAFDPTDTPTLHLAALLGAEVSQ